jgi:hypothetical protein
MELNLAAMKELKRFWYVYAVIPFISALPKSVKHKIQFTDCINVMLGEGFSLVAVKHNDI